MRSLVARVGWTALALATACAGDPPPKPLLAPGHAGAPGVREFLVCAPNTVLSLPADLQHGTAPLREEIAAHLREHGREVEWVDLYEAKQAWSRALATAKRADAIESTPAFFADELARERSFDALLMPSILVHEAPASRGFASWDGVRRKLGVGEMRTRRRRARRVAQSLPQMPVTSLHLMVFSRSGERVFEGRGGLEITVEVGAGFGSEGRELELRPRSDLFRDRSALREGVEVAFGPYLGPPPGP